MLTQAHMAEARPRGGGIAPVGPRARNLIVVCRDLGCQPGDHIVHQVAQSPKASVFAAPFHAPKQIMEPAMMSPKKKVERKMVDAAVIRAVMPKDTVKRLARRMAVPFGTAHEWVYRNLSAARRRELALALLAELDEQERSRAVIRQHLEEVVAEDALASPGDGLAIDETRRAQDGAKTC